MKISLLSTIIIVTLSIFIPYMLLIYIGQKDTIKKNNLFKKTIKTENLSLIHQEKWNTNFIGIDTDKKLLVFMQLNDNDLISHRIDLNIIASCQIRNETKRYKVNKSFITSLSRLEIEIKYINNKTNELLLFFDAEDVYGEDFEMKRAEKWQKLIQEQLIKNNITQSAA